MNLACHFLLVGYPVEAVHDFCKKNKLQNYCTLSGRVPYEDLAHYLAMADIAIEPKLSDSGEASGKLLNYMGAALPVVCFDTESNRQILGDSGFYVTADGQSSRLAEKISTILTDTSEVEKMGKSGRDRVREKFSWQVAGEKVLQVYHSCLNN